MKKLLFVMAMLLMAAVVAFPPVANATLTLWLSDGSTTVTIVDNGAGDSAASVTGEIVYMSPVGSPIGVWSLNVSTGVSKPILGGSSSAQMDLNSINNSTGAGTLTIKLYDDSFNLPTGSGMATMIIGGTQGSGQITYTTYYDINNAMPPGTLIDTGVGPLTDQGFTGTAQGNVLTDNAFSLMQVVEIKHTSKGISSFDANLTVVSSDNPVPIPPTVLLMGSGLVGLIGLGYRRKRKI
jgi:hypothetical protein